MPVVPTGALVSSAGVVALHQSSPFSLLIVFAVASAAAFLGDICLYWLGQRGVRSKNGSKWLRTISGRAAPERLAQAQQKLDEHGAAVLVLSRLVPAGRIPVMLACLLGRMPLRRFARGDVAGVSGVGGDVPADRHSGRFALPRAMAGGGRGGGSDAAGQRGARGVAEDTGPVQPLTGRGAGSSTREAPIGRSQSWVRGCPARCQAVRSRVSGSSTGSAESRKVAQCIGAIARAPRSS